MTYRTIVLLLFSRHEREHQRHLLCIVVFPWWSAAAWRDDGRTWRYHRYITFWPCPGEPVVRLWQTQDGGDRWRSRLFSGRPQVSAILRCWSRGLLAPQAWGAGNVCWLVWRLARDSARQGTDHSSVFQEVPKREKNSWLKVNWTKILRFSTGDVTPSYYETSHRRLGNMRRFAEAWVCFIYNGGLSSL